MQMNSTKTVPSVPFKVFAASGALVFVAVGILFGRHYTNTAEGLVSNGLIGGAVLFIPCFAIVLAIQAAVARLSRPLEERHPARRRLLVSAPAVLVLLGTCIYSFWVLTIRENSRAFEKYFSR